MGLKSFNPYTASRRFITVVDKSHITKQEPEKALLEPKKRTGGRNNHGEIVVWHRGGGHKQQYRKVDFRRDKLGVPAKVAAIEYDPNRSSNLALLHYADGEKRYILHPVGLEVGATVSTGEGADILPGNALQFSTFLRAPWCTTWSCIPDGRAGGALRRRLGAVAQQRRRSRSGEAALRRSSKVFRRLHGHGRPGRQSRSRKRNLRQSGTHALARHQADCPRRGYESGGPSARRW